MSMNLEQRDELRLAVLNFLAHRSAAAFNASQIGDRIRIEALCGFMFADTDVSHACEPLISAGLVTEIKEELFSSISHYQITEVGKKRNQQIRESRGMA